MFLESLEKKRERKREEKKIERVKECKKYKMFNININALHEKRVLSETHRSPHVVLELDRKLAVSLS